MQSVLVQGKQPSAAKLLMVFLALLLCPFYSTSATSKAAAATHSSQIWNFDADPVGELSEHFVVGTLFNSRLAGEWKVIDMKTFSNFFLQSMNPRESRRIIAVLNTQTAPSPPHVLAQLVNKGFEHDYKMVLIQGTLATDFELEVSFLSVAGRGDMGGGLIWRAQDDRNYDVARANPLEQNIRLYRVVKGVRKHHLATIDQIITVDTWHTLRVTACGEHFQVRFDGKSVLKVHDHTFMTGEIGLWTKADAITYFDDLQLFTVRECTLP